MFSVNSKQVDWSEEFERWDTSCPTCEGSGETDSREGTWRYTPVDERFDACSEISRLGGEVSMFASRLA